MSIFSKKLPLLFGLSLRMDLYLKGDLVHSKAVALYFSVKYWSGVSLMLRFQVFKEGKAFSF